MSRPLRFLTRLLFAGAVAGVGYFGWISMVGSPAAMDLLPAGAAGVVELRGAQDVAGRLTGTKFAAAFARSGIRAWLEQSDVVRSLDALRADIGRVTGFTPSRRIVYDLVGSEAALGWYPPAHGAAAADAWVATGRLSARGWAAAAALRIARRLGLGAGMVVCEEVAGNVVYAFPTGGGRSLSLLLAGRVLVLGPERELVLQAARAGRDATASVGRDPALKAIRGALPSGGELFVWVRDPLRLRRAVGEAPAANAADTGAAGAGALIRTGKTIEIDVAAAPARARAAGSPSVSAHGPLPGVALLRRRPLLFFASGEPVPAALTGLLSSRREAVAARLKVASAAADDLLPGRGYALVITDSSAGSGLFPTPQGLVMIGMADARSAEGALPLLFPPTSRAATVGSLRALATRESFPLAGSFDLWGAAVGTRLVFATDTALIAAAAEDAAISAGEFAIPEPAWHVTALAAVSMDKALPLLHRWSAPLSGWIGARWPQAPDLTRDADLLAAIRTASLASGADERFDRAAITLSVGDLP